MKNEQMERLTELARDAWVELPELVLDGRGTFRTLYGEEVAATDVLGRVTLARDKIHDVMCALEAIPRNKGRKQAG